MPPVVAIIAQGAMGAGIARRLTEHGVTVLTSLEGRGDASAQRAAAAGMRAVDMPAIAGADIILSIVPPAEAMAMAQRLAPHLGTTSPTYADCNAVSPETAQRIAAVFHENRAAFVDGGIIGGPPRADGYTPVLYVAGPEAQRLLPLGDHGLDIRITPGPLGAASALKMSYAGITKGLTALAAAMVGAATRAGAAPGLLQELERSQPELLHWFRHMLPTMPDKAYRWVGEMREIADFVGPDAGARDIYLGAAGLYAKVAATPEEQAAMLRNFLGGEPS